MLPYDPDPDIELNATGLEVPIGYFWALAVLFAVGLITIAVLWLASVIPTKASWYSNQEEGPITASGERFHDQELTAASWDWPFGTCLQVQNQANQKTVAVRINDRWPAKRLYQEGRKIDLSIGAFERIADPKEGIIRVKISKTSRENCDDKKTSK